MTRILIILLAIAAVEAVAIILLYAYTVMLEKQSTKILKFCDEVINSWDESNQEWEKLVIEQRLAVIDQILAYLRSEDQLRPDQFRIVYDEVKRIREIYAKDVG